MVVPASRRSRTEILLMPADLFALQKMAWYKSSFDIDLRVNEFETGLTKYRGSTSLHGISLPSFCLFLKNSWFQLVSTVSLSQRKL